MESLAKKIILFSIIGVISYAAIIFVSNKKEVKERSNNSLVNQSINNMDYKNSARIKTLMKSIDETYNSTNTIKLLHANELLEEGSFDKSIEILDTISNTKSIVINELTYSLKAKAFALADNRVSDLGTYDKDFLAEMISSVSSNLEMLEATSFTETDLEKLVTYLKKLI